MLLGVLGREETLKGDFRDFDVLSFSANTKYLPYPLREGKGTLKLTHGIPRFRFSGAGPPMAVTSLPSHLLLWSWTTLQCFGWHPEAKGHHL